MSSAGAKNRGYAVSLAKRCAAVFEGTECPLPIHAAFRRFSGRMPFVASYEAWRLLRAMAPGGDVYSDDNATKAQLLRTFVQRYS